MTILLKESSAPLDNSIDCLTDYLAGDAPAGSSWTVEPN